jgi:hypothetical protein
MILEETSNIGGIWSVDVSLSTLDFKWVIYNNEDVTSIMKGKRETILWEFFNERYDLEKMQADYFSQMRSSFAMLTQ